MTYGDHPAADAPTEAADASGSADEGIRQPDPRSVPAPAQSPEATPAARPLEGSLDSRTASDSGSRPSSPNDDQAPLVSADIREAVRLELQQLVPGMAERLLVIAEKSATGQIDTADRLATAEIESAKIGQSLAFALTLFAFIAAVVFFALGNRWAGVAFTSVPVAMLIRSFLRRSDGGTA